MTRDYRERHSILTLMRQLNRLVSAIQKHRGVSLAHLAGDGLFVDDVARIQAQVNQRLVVWRSTVERFDDLISPREQQKIQQGWDTVCHNWEEDGLLENFEYHSFLIDQLLQLNGGLSRKLEVPLRTFDEETEADDVALNDPVLPLVCRSLPELVEDLARIRGLATQAAVVGECYEDHQKKLLYWLQCVERKNRELMAAIDNLGSSVLRSWQALSELKNYELKLAFFLNTVKKDVIQGKGAKADARQLFGLGSEIIDVYVDSIDGGITLLQSRLESELEAWLVSV
ncbi:MAG: hypothetical protein ACRBBW_00855 [Cellvibrionaceae bacterium]